MWDSELDLRVLQLEKGCVCELAVGVSFLLSKGLHPSAEWNCSTVIFRVFLVVATQLAVWSKPLCCIPGLGKVEPLLVFSVERCQWD